MAGRVLRVVPRVTVDFSKVANGSSTVILARQLNVAAFREVTLYVRFHTGTNMATPTTAQIIVYADGFTEEDPGSLATGGLPGFLTPIGTALDFKSAAANSMSVYQVTTTLNTISAGFGGLLAIGATCTQAASVSALAVISIDLCGKE